MTETSCGSPRAMHVLATERLNLRHLTTDDDAFVLELVNDPSFIRNIGDRGVRNLADARQYVLNGPVASYEKFGFGMYLVELKESGVPIGMCGFVKRDWLAEVDIGFAFLPQFWSKGYALESAAATKAYGREVLGLERIVAITSPDNVDSIRLLEKIGLRFDGMVRPANEESDVRLFVSDA
ncbi:MAG TPA: GNAT family N-acetyltransferase [Steroidobacteraceae bacterium]